MEATLYKNRADLSIAHGALTNSKRPSCFVDGVYPTHMKRGQGCYLWDENGRKYIDYICGLGVNILGYANRDVNNAIIKALGDGSTLSFSSTLEVEYAEDLKAKFPYMDLVRILKSGSEGCSAAIRIARAYTGKNYILSEGYHGWHDEFTSLTEPAYGVPKASRYQILELTLEKLVHCPDVAAVIIEPVIVDYSKARLDYLKEIHEICKERGIVLIFDETITAMRFPKLSFANFTGLRPDLSIMGKALGNGSAISIVGGKREIMDADYFVSSTYSGERSAIAAGLATLKSFTKYDSELLWKYGGLFLERFNAIDPDLVRIDGYNTRGVFVADTLVKSLFFQECSIAGVLFGSSWFYNFELHKEIDTVINLCTLVLRAIKRGDVSLKGKLIQKPFKKAEYGDDAKK